MELNLKGKVAGISGAAAQNGIGYNIAKALLQEGCSVFICDIDDAKLKECEKTLSEFGTVFVDKCDVSDEASVKSFFQKVYKRFNKIDIWINNAGICPQQKLLEMTANHWDNLMSINVKSVFMCTKEVALYMKESGGVIINAASFAALIPSAGSGGYAATKAAVLSLTKTFAAELAPLNIRVNAYIPGVIETSMTKGVIDNKGDSLVSQIALGRLGKPQDVAKAVVFLASDAADYITGTYIEVSGGKFCVQNPDFCR